MLVLYRTHGFFVKKRDFGEADQQFTLYTKDFGKVQVIGRGIRKITSKLRQGAELFYLSEITFVQGKTYKTLVDAMPIEKFKNIRNDTERLEIVWRISDIVDTLIKGEEPDEQLWTLLSETLFRLHNLKNCKQAVLYSFLWSMCALLGYRVDLYHCASCQKKLFPRDLYFNPGAGGILDTSCFAKIQEGKRISPDSIKILRMLLVRDWQVLPRLKIDKLHEQELESVSEQYLAYCTERA